MPTIAWVLTATLCVLVLTWLACRLALDLEGECEHCWHHLDNETDLYGTTHKVMVCDACGATRYAEDV
jgi:hypothetical protein